MVRTHHPYFLFSRGFLYGTQVSQLGVVNSSEGPRGTIFFIQAWIDCQSYVLIYLHLPPPASISILYDAARFAATFPHSRVICMGGFNLLHDYALDKFMRPDFGGLPGTKSHLALFLEEIGWLDLWRFYNPQTFEYTCFTPGRNSLSRIDYVCGNSQTCSSE